MPNWIVSAAGFPGRGDGRGRLPLHPYPQSERMFDMARSKPIRVTLPSGERAKVTVLVDRQTPAETGRPGTVAGLSFGFLIKIEPEFPDANPIDDWRRLWPS
jgi:hypothetical protein